jgi:hypothetical protein
MSRISIDVTPEDHKRLKVLAALKGVSLRNFLLAGKLEEASNSGTMVKLEALLDDRIEHHNNSGLEGRASAKVILDDVLASR